MGMREHGTLVRRVLADHVVAVLAAGAAQDDAGSLSVTSDQFSIVVDLIQVPTNRSPVPAATLPNWTLAPDATPERGRVRGVRRP